MSKQRTILALNAIERRVANRGDFYTDEGRHARMQTCIQLVYALETGAVASFQRMWKHFQRGPYWEQAEDVMGELFDELGVNTIDELYSLIA